MNTCKKLVCLILIKIIINNNEVYARTLTKVTNFDDYDLILQQTLDFKQKLRLIEAIWAEIRIDYAEDLNKASKLYRQLDYTIESFLAVQNEIQAAKELKQELRLHLQMKNAEFIAKTWTGFKSNEPNEQLQNHLNLIIKDFDAILLTQIYKTAIDLNYGIIEPTQLSAHIRQTLIAINDKSFEIVLEAQLYLFDKFINEGDVSEKFLFNIAYYLHKMKRHYFFKYLKQNLKQRFWKTIAELPTTLSQLFFKSEFCLFNKKYNEYLYATNSTKIDNERHYIFTWGTPNAVNELGIWQMNITEVGGDVELNLKFSFSNKYSNSFMYLEPKIQNYENIIVAWHGINEPINSYWSLRLQDEVLIFENAQKLLCATQEFFDGRRFIYGRYDAEHNPDTENCQWLATACPG